MAKQVFRNVSKREIAVSNGSVLRLHRDTEEVRNIKHLLVIYILFEEKPFQIFLDRLADDHTLYRQDLFQLDQRFFQAWRTY